MAVEITALQRQRIDTAANWAAENPVLLDGEIGYERDTSKLKIGDGSTAWNLLAYTPWSGVNSYPFVDADIAANAGINKAKIAGTAIVANDVATVTNAMLAGDIDVAKLTEGTARQLLQVNAAGTVVEWTNDIDIPGRLDVTGIAVFDDNVTVQGDLTVTGTTTTIDSQNLLVEDKNIEMGVVTSPTDITADGGGITLRGATNKTINWVNSLDSWTSSEHVNLLNGKEFKIDGIKVLDAASLGTGITGSSLTSVGTIATGVWQGSAIDVAYLDSTVVTTADSGTVTGTMIVDGTIQNVDINANAGIVDTKLDTISTAGKVSNSATTATSLNTVNAIVTRDASGDFSAGTITADLTGNADTATTLDSPRTFQVTGDVTGSVSSDLTSGASIATSIAAGVIVDADINAAAAIADTKLDTISTAGKVSNSATTATDVNTASTIVSRDASGDFSAGTITADLTGNAATATNATTSDALSSARTFAVTGDVTGTVSSDLTSGASIATSIAAGVIVDADVNAAANIADTKLGTISTAGKVSNSATTATDANTASAIVSRDASGNFSAGTVTADLAGNADTATTANTAGALSSARNFAVTGDVTGTVSSDLTSGASIATSIAAGVIVDADINAAAGIADTKLGTISTAGKVDNSATTATDANTASAIVARDASGNFSAGTITANLTGNADTATSATSSTTAGALSSARTFEVTGDVTGSVSSDLTSGASIATSIAAGAIVDADVNASAAIAGTKIDPDFGSQTVNAGKYEFLSSFTTVTPLQFDRGAVGQGIKINLSSGKYEIESTDKPLDLNASSATGKVRFFTNGSEGMRVDENGNVGIGTSSPDGALQVVGNALIGASGSQENSSYQGEFRSNGNATLKIQAGATNTAYVGLGTTSDALSNSISINNSTGDFQIRVNSAARQTILANGNVGIGTTSPAALLHVQDNAGTTGQTLQQWTADLGVNTRAAYLLAPEVDNLGDPFIFFTNNSWQFRVDTADALTIDDTGNVGIGTSAPENKLDVAGTIAVDRPSNYWNNHGVIVFGAGGDGPIGEIGHHAGYELSLTSNGYRNDAAQWTSHGVNTQTGAAQIALNPAGRILFRTDSNLATGGNYNLNEAVRIDENGNVGIGTSSPNSLLNLPFGDGTNAANTIQIGTTNDLNVDKIYSLGWGDPAATQMGIGPYSTTRSVFGSRHGLTIHIHEDDEFSVKSTSWTNLFGIEGGTGNAYFKGNVGIGTASPGEKLEVNGKIKATDINFTGLATYADDSAAGTGGLVAGDVYKTSTGELRIKL